MQYRKIKLASCITLLSILLAIPVHLSAQVVDEFPSDSAEFVDTFQEFIENKISKKNESTFEDFISNWESGKFTEKTRDSIGVIANKLLEINGRREPHFIKMMEVFLEMENTTFYKQYFDEWMQAFRYASTQQKSELATVMRLFNFTLNFHHEKCLYASSTRKWYALSNDYQIEFDTTLKIKYKNTDIKCKFREDSIQIFNTSGIFYPYTNQWEGQKGTVTWERAGYSKNDIYARLSDYNINMTKTEYEADSVEFVNKLYFDEPVLGKLEDKLEHIITQKKAIYPVFQSYKKIFEISDIYQNMDFTGGFKMNGAQFTGSGGQNQDARITIYSEDTLFMTVESDIFILEKERAISKRASVVVHLNQDSIYHSGLQFNYNVNSQEIEFTANENITSKSPYYNTYHNIFMKFDRLLWNVNDKKIYFTHGKNSTSGNAEFTSNNYFTLNKWMQLEMRDERHPLIAIRNYCNKIDSKKFDVNNFAKYQRKSTHQVKHRLYGLAQDGFILYDTATDTITVNDRLYNFINSRIEKIDYDVMQLESNTERPNHNGVLDLSNMELTINGVPSIKLSDSQDVKIYPDESRIVMKENRHFDFGGEVEAGLFNFFGESFYFNYDDFKITLDTIDSLKMRFQTEEMDEYGQAVLAQVENTINSLSGDIYIDKPDNKSGRALTPRYPMFESKQKSYVYYDDLFDGPYKKEDFYFELFPFQMDSLDNFNPENLKFDGNFYSSGIFPPFEETLKLRDDNSLGLTKETPEEGYPLYEGKGKYFDTIDMSNKGLKGQGVLSYLTAEMETDDILFFPDSTSIHANSFTMDEKTTGIEYPEVASQNVNVQWYPHEDVMYIDQTDTAFTMYNEKNKFDGDLTLKPTGLSGTGELDMSKAILTSKYFSYDANSFTADSSDFLLRTFDQTDKAFTANEVDARIDYNDQRGRFQTNNSYTKSKFHQNLYESYLDKFTWRINENALEIKSIPQPETTYGKKDELEQLKDFDGPGALFLSNHKGQDSLRFISSEAEYLLENNTINATQVDSVYVADASLVPDKKELNIGEKAEMDTLNMAEIFANRTQRFHKFFDAKIKIKGRNEYSGEGNYDYIDKNKEKQTIHFDDIEVNKQEKTIAEGEIAHADSFNLSPHFRYRGKTHLRAEREHLEFKGGTRMYHNCPTINPRYIYFEEVLDPDDIHIPIGEQLKDLKGNKVFVGSYITRDSSHIYSTFLTPRKDPSHIPLISSKGYLKADEKTSQYIIAEKPKMENPEDSTGPIIRLNKNTCMYNAQGKISLGVDLGEIGINPAGEFDHDLMTNKVKLDLTIPLNFMFSEEALDTMRNEINEMNNLDVINLNSKRTRINLNEIYDLQTTEDFFTELDKEENKRAIPDEIESTLLLSNIKLNWNTETESYLSEGKIGVALINGKPVNKYMDGYVEFVKRRSGDRMYIYLQPDDDTFYFFYYFRGMLRVYSSNKHFISSIQDIPERKRTIRDNIFSPVQYRYILTPESRLNQFYKHKREIEEKYKNGNSQNENQEEREKEKEKEQ
ncbi:MAG: hypothetical protein ACLFNL_01235 [Bacteroidales bacterium]